jgi:predicted AAA+ superfamily ATPase
MVDKLFEISDKRLKNTELKFKRYLYDLIDDTERLIGLTGARGIGKTTILLQKLKTLNLPAHEGFYASMDDIYFATHRLVDLADEFVKKGGKYMFLDEVHKYETWSIELKNIYDNYPELKVMFTGSSVLEMSKTQGDLSRRAMVYKLETMSFREYLTYEMGLDMEAITISELLEKHTAIANDLTSNDFKPLKYFETFLKYGSYPFSIDNKSGFYEKLRNTITLIIETDLAAAAGIDFSTGLKIKKLLGSISECVPFKPNMIELAAKI